MGGLTAIGLVGQGLEALAAGVDHLALVDAAQGSTIVALSAHGGGLVVLSFGHQGEAQISDTQIISDNLDSYSNRIFSLILTPDGVVAAVTRSGDNTLLGYEISSGMIGATVEIEAQGIGAPSAVIYHVSDSGMLFTAGSDGVLRSFRADGSTSYLAAGVTQDSDSSYHALPAALESLTIDGSDFLLTACLQDTGISVYRVDADSGDMSHTGAVSTESGLGILPTIVDVKTASVGDQGYALVLSRANASKGAALSVLVIDENGRPHPTDHILDNRLTRFGAASELEVIQTGDWVYVLVSGADGGVSLFTLSPVGKLVHLDTIESSVGVMLNSVSAMTSAIASDGDIQVLLAQHTVQGFTQIEIDLSGQGFVYVGDGGVLLGTSFDDMLSGSAGSDTLEGGAGNDILEDGAGSDVLRGGAGDDIFILTADGEYDVIEGFRWDQDRIDLSHVPLLYSMSQIVFSSRSWGAVLAYKGEALEVRSAGGAPLTEEQVAAALDWAVDRPPLVLREAGQALSGTSAADTLTGGAGNDTLAGLGGDDRLTGDFGADNIQGGVGDDTIDAGAGPDTVEGGAGRDVIFLGAGEDFFNDSTHGYQGGADTVFGGDGDDLITSYAGTDEQHGEAGNDTLVGGVDADRLYGGTNFDTIYAGEGDDTAWGGDGRDLIFLNQGDDVFNDNSQGGVLGRDTVFGGFGDDTIEGGNGNDVFYGEWGDDIINARLGNDSVYGGEGRDTIYGGEGDDVAWGGDGRDLIFLGSGDDIFIDNSQGGDLGRDTVFAGLGSDTVEGGNGDDVFFGDAGDDIINARLGSDSIYGGAGDDTIYAGEGDDTAWGGDGRDLIFLNQGDDVFYDNSQGGVLGRDTVFGGFGDDTIEGGNGNDVFYGEWGDDIINARLGNDSVYGGDGDDVLNAGAGTNQIAGGEGADIFVFDAQMFQDTVRDFTSGIDRLELSGALVGGQRASQVAGAGIVTDTGVWLTFGGGQSILLEGLTSTVTLGGDIDIA